MAAQENQKMQEVISLTQDLLKEMSSDSDLSVDLEWLKKKLPALAINLMRSGEDVTQALLYSYIDKGQDYIARQLLALKQGQKDERRKPPKLTYESVVESLAKSQQQQMDEDALFAKELDEIKNLIATKQIDIHADNDYVLRAAAENGHYEIVDLLLAHGANIHAVNDYALLMAAANGHYEIVELLLAHDADIHAWTDAALRHAAENGHYEIVELLLVHDADNDYALRAAVRSGHCKIVDLLLAHGADIHANDNEALRHAAENGHCEIVELLLAHDADIHAYNDFTLRIAAENGHYEIVELLLAHGADIHAGHDHALLMAAVKGHYDVVELLLAHGADIHACNDVALLMAAMKGHYEIVELLLAHGADIHADNDHALRMAAENGHCEIVELLLAHDADIHADNDHALRMAAENGHYETVELLLVHHADIHADNDYALREAAKRGHYEVVEILLAHGANVHAWSDGALRIAVVKGHYKVADLLLANGADIHARNDEVLRFALAARQYEVVDTLLTHGISIDMLKPAQKEKLKIHKKWRNLHGDFVPPACFLDKNPYDFKLKTYLAVHDALEKEGYKGDACAEYAYNISTLFRGEERAWQYLQKWGKAGKQPLHDIGHAIKIPDKIPQGGAIDYKAWGDAVLQQGPNMARLVKFADRVAQPLKSANGQVYSYKNTKLAVAEFVFKNAAKHPELAGLCFEFEWDDDDFDAARKQVKKYKKLFAAHGLKKPRGRIPDITIDGAEFGKPEYQLHKLPDGDVRGLFLGEFTDCCQHLADAGRDCAKHGFLSEEGGFYVVAHKKTQEIIAQSWAWRGATDELVFDSLESLRNRFDAANWSKLATCFADKIAGDQDSDISAFHIGAGGATPSLAFNEARLAKPLDYDGYRDSKKNQYAVRQFEYSSL